MKRLLALCALLAACTDINLYGDGEAATEACKPYAGVYYWTTSNASTPARSSTWTLYVMCRDQTQVNLPRRK